MRLKRWIEDGFVLVVILLNILDFLEVLPGDLDFAKKILSWVCLGYLVYHVNLAKLVFGKDAHEDIHGLRLGIKPSDINFLIIISYFLLIFKNMVHFASGMIAEYEEALVQGKVILTDLSHMILEALAQNSMEVNQATFVVGTVMLILISLFAALKYDIRAPSIMALIHEQGDPTRRKLLVRFVSIFLILTTFYIVIFNFFMEWLAFAVDAPILVLGILVYMYFMLRNHKSMNPESMIYKIGNFGENFYENFLNMLYTRKGIFLGLSGMLILHLLTDVGNFIIPHTVGLHDQLYFAKLEQITAGAHEPLKELLLSDLSGVSLFSQIGIVWTYAWNVIGFLMLMILPGYIWYKVYISKGFRVSKTAIAVFFTAMTVIFTAGLFTIKGIGDPTQTLVGVDITTQGFFDASSIAIPWVVMLFSILVGAVTYLLTNYFKPILVRIAIILVDLFFGYYIWTYSSDYLSAYINIIGDMFSQGFYIQFGYILLFFLITILFYVGSFILYIMETVYEFSYVE